MTKLDKYMRNQGKGNFDFDSFKAMYDADPKIQALVTNFDQEKIEFKNSEMDDLNTPAGATGNTVGNMAKRATDVGSGL
jgi:hypothetical protein